LPESILQPPWLDAQAPREGRYVIGPPLGHGSMGDVFEAWDIVLARPVALKILKHLEPAAMIRFMHEAQLHARLDSPNICRIYDVDATGGTPRIAMQLIRGPNLEDASNDLSLAEIIDILAQVAEAVHGAHRQNLIHRDIKPSNILLQWHGPGRWTPYLCDFGLAMALDGPSVTQPLAITGTPAYMAPEQVRGDRSLVGPPTDVYGIGSTLYFTLLGRPPCVSTTTGEMLKVKRERRFPSPRALDPQLSPALEAILFKCLEPAPQDRYPTAAALAEALRQFQATLAEPPGPAAGPSPAGWARRRKALALAAGLAGLAALLAAGGTALWRRQARGEELAQALAIETSSLEHGITRERLLPAHDLRPADAGTRDRMERLRARRGALGPGTEGRVVFALGQAHFLLGDLAQARVELGEAWTAGLRTPETAFMLARACGETYLAACQEAAFLGEPPPPRAAEDLAAAERWLLEARLQTGHPQEYAEALAAFLRGDYPKAAAAAREALKANPWHLESAILASRALALAAKAANDIGDADGSRTSFREALDLARTGLARGPSEPRLHHAYCTAALGLAAAELERGELTPHGLEDLERQADLALGVAPDRPEAQSDWLQVRALKARCLAALGQDPRPELDQALQFYWARTREPRTVDLRTDHMVLYWLQAQADFARDRNPGPALAEAMKDLGHAAGRDRDFQGDLFNFKARVEAARGQDPRPTLDLVVARFQPLAEQGIYSAGEIAGKAWLTRAEWEASHALEAGESLQRAQAMLAMALNSRPTSAAAHALQGLCHVLEARQRPERRGASLALARDHLRWCQRLNPGDPDLARLRSLLGGS